MTDEEDPTYVGTLVGVVTIDGDEIEVEPRVLGVTPEDGIVTAASRPDLRDRIFDGPPKRGTTLDLHAVLYDRLRQGYPGKHWIHETPGAKAKVDKSNPPYAYLIAPAERRCDMAGDFLCSQD